MENAFKIKKGLIVNASGSTAVDIQGSSGQLFSITDSLTGVLMSVNDISGLPILEVSDNDQVKMGTFGAEGMIIQGSDVILPNTSNSAGDILTIGGNNKLGKRTISEILSDIGAVPTSRTITINSGDGLTGGAAQNLGANRTWNLAVDSTVVRTSGNQTIGGTKTFSSTIAGSINGNAATATTLQTARTINGTSFNGSVNITTANWGTARTLTIGSTGKSVNGSGNVSWSLAEIGAAATSHTHTASQISNSTTVGQNLITLTNPGAITFLRVNANNTVDALNAANFRTAIGAGTGTLSSVNLGYTAAATNGVVTNTAGNNATIPAATTSLAGLMTNTDKSKLDGIAAGAQVNVGTNLGITAGTTAGPIVTSSTGTNATLPTASASASGVVTTGNQTWSGTKTFSSTIVGSINGNAATATTATNLNRQVIAGNGLTGGGTLDADRTLTVGAGDGISVTSTAVQVDGTVVRTSGNQTIGGNKTFTNNIIIGGTAVRDAINLNNSNIINVNNITISDPGPDEGIQWLGGNGWRIYESPDNLTNTGGNLQFVTTSTRRMTLQTDGRLQLGEQANATSHAVRADRTLRVAGTANQVTVNNGSGNDNAVNLTANRTWTLSLPQNIHTAATPTFGGLTINGNIGLRAAATTSVATQIPVFIANPDSTTRTIVTRTPAQLRGDIGAGTGNGTVTSITAGDGLSGGAITTSGTIAVDSTVVRTSGNQTIGGRKTFSSGLVGSNTNRILMPGGARFSTSTNVITGAIRIQLPTARFNSNTMMTMKVVIYNYSTQTSRILHIGGYNNTGSGGQWVNCFATQESDNTVGDITVRFGRSASRNFIYIGETGTTWSYPQVFITEFNAGFSGISNAWADGWAIDFVTGFENVTRTETARTDVKVSGDQTISGTKTFSSTIVGSINGNAVTATTWETARTLTIGATGKSVNGSGDVSWSLAEIGAAATSHTHTASQISNSTTVGQNLITLTNPSAITFLRVNANNTVDALSAANFRTAIGAGTGTLSSVNLGYTAAATNGVVTNTAGNNATIPAATTSLAGLMTNTDKSKLDGIAAGAQVNVGTNLGITAGTTAGPIVTSSTGTNATLPTASASASGVVTTGAQTWAGVKTFSSTISGSINGNAATVTNGVYTTGNQSIGGTKTFTNNIFLANNTSLRQTSTSTWSGNPGASVGKLEYHSNRWYIVAGGSSNRIVQFRRDGTDVSHIDNSGVYHGNISGTATNVSRSVVAGNGLTGGGTLNANRTLNVGAGTGISVSSTAVSVDYSRVEERVPINTGRGNLDNPTAREVALFHGEANNKFRFISPTLQEESTNGTTWTTSSAASNVQLRNLVLGEGQTTSISAPRYYRLTWDVVSQVEGQHITLSEFYSFLNTSGNIVDITIERRRNVSQDWVVVSEGEVANFPGHFYMPHTNINYVNAASDAHSTQVRVTFANRTNAGFTLNAIEWVGGFPASRRNVFSYNSEKEMIHEESIRIERNVGYNSNFDRGIIMGATNAQSVNSGRSHAWRVAVSGNASGQSLRIQRNLCDNFSNNTSTGFLETILVDYLGRVGLLTTSPTHLLTLPNTATDAGGRGRANSWTTYSDGRVKTNRKELPYGLSELMKLEPIQYFHHSSELDDNGDIKVLEHGETSIGFVAQDVLDIIPEIVSVPSDVNKDLYSMDYAKITPLLVKAIQEQQIIIEDLKNRLDNANL